MELVEELRPLVDRIVAAGGVPFAVGGCVRDELLGIESKDIDIEVHEIGIDELLEALRSLGNVDLVGKSFGVLKMRFAGLDLDISLPRRDSKVAEGHTGFQISVDPFMGIDMALSRRDFTINAIALNLQTDQLVDPFDGVMHLRQGKLVAVSDAFSEDPLRVLRGIQFVGRFGLRMDERTVEMCRELLPEIDSLSLERIWGEWEKVGLKADQPHFRRLVETVEAVGLQGRFGHVAHHFFMNLEGISGNCRISVVLAGLGVDPELIGAPNDITRWVQEIHRLLAFRGSFPESRSVARTLRLATFSDAARINSRLFFDPTIADGPIAPLITGKDLIAEGFTPGPEMGEILRKVTQAQDEGHVRSKQEALALAQRVQ